MTVPQTLQQWAPLHADWTSGLLLQYDKGYLFALEPLAHWTRDGEDVRRIRILGIGGHRQPGETWSEAVRREAREEAGIDIALTSAPETDLLGPGDAHGRIALDWPGHPCPRLVWQATYQFPDRTSGQAISRTFVGLVFQACVVQGTPHPGAEVPGLILLAEEHLLRLGQEPLPLRQVVAKGARLLPGALDVPQSAFLALGGSAQWIARWLQISVSEGQG